VYRSKEEIEEWTQGNNPILRFKSYLQQKNLWNNEEESLFRTSIRTDILTAFSRAEKQKKPPVAEMFHDVYQEMPWNLMEQQAELEQLITDNPDAYPLKDHVSFHKAHAN